MVLERLRRRRHDFFCCIDFFCWKPLFQYFAGTLCFFCWNHVCFLLEPYQCVSLETHHFCWNHIIVLLEPYQLFAGTMCFAFQTGVAIFCYNRRAPTRTASSERRTARSQRSFEVARAGIDGVCCVFFLCMRGKKTGKEKEKDTRSDGSQLLDRVASSRPAERLGRRAGA